jgi:hypothetical protein
VFSRCRSAVVHVMPEGGVVPPGASFSLHTARGVKTKGQAGQSASAFPARFAIQLMRLPVSLSSASHAGTRAAFFFT